MVLPNRAKVSQVNPNRQKAAAAAAAVEVRKAKDVPKGIEQRLLFGTTDTSSINSICSRAAYSCCNACYMSSPSLKSNSNSRLEGDEMRAVMLAYLLLLLCRYT